MAREKGVAETQREFSFADLKGDIDRLGEMAGGINWNSGGPAWLHPARAATTAFGDKPDATGVAGQLARATADKLKLRQEIFLSELLLDPFFVACTAARKALRYTPVSKYQSVERDFSLVLKDGVAFAHVSGAIRALGIEELIDLEAVDVFRGGSVPAGQYSLLVRATFQSATTTLTDAQLNDFSTRIANALHDKLAASLRTA
jgi:phenylalanyl-tRNA synthetase beta chain